MAGARASARGLARALRCVVAPPPRTWAATSRSDPDSNSAAAAAAALHLPSLLRRHLHAAAAALGRDCPLPAEFRQADGSVLRRPEEPDPEECCGRGCVECIWTRYTRDLQEYQSAVAAAQGYEVPLDPFEALERRLAAQTAQLQDADGQGL